MDTGTGKPTVSGCISTTKYAPTAGKKESEKMISEETKTHAREGKTARELLELEVHWALYDLSGYFEKANSPLYYDTNKLIHGLDKIMNM